MLRFPNPKLPSNLEHSFAQSPQAQIERSSFRRPFTVKTTFDAGYLIPFYCDEVLPGDTFNMRMTALARLATPIFPLMDNMYMDVHFFAVPKRLVWDYFQEFQGELDDPFDPDHPPTERLYPVITCPAGGWTVGSLADYFGLPVGVDNVDVCSLWHRAYNLIYNQWYRSEHMIDSVTVDKGLGPDTDTNYVLRRRNKRHDYFTSCLPWPQRGVDVMLPLGDSAPVELVATGPGPTYGPARWFSTDQTGVVRSVAPGSSETINFKEDGGGGSDAYGFVTDATDSSTHRYVYNPVGTLAADLSSATASTINAFREAVQLQRLLERDARGGTRYVEILKAHWGVTSPDFRLQRAEYLGGGTININVTPVPQTSITSGSSPTGKLSGVGIGVNGRPIGFVKSFVEHCVILGILSVRADMTYYQGIPRMFSRSTRYDEYLPALAHLGEQEVLNKEIYFNNDSHDDEVFGYQERWAEYRYGNSRVTGLMRPGVSGTLSAWNLSQTFSALPVLDQTFIEEDPPVDRVIAVNTEPHFICDIFCDLVCARPMPMYSVPGMVDHF